MVKRVLAFVTVIASCSLSIIRKPAYVTSDIPLFWQAVDSLKTAVSTADSMRLIQTLYLDRMSREGRDFIAIRKYTAEEYLRTIKQYPKYLKQLRLKTDRITKTEAELDSAFKKLGNAIPDYERPRVCFAIGCFRGGGTTKKDLILMGSEIALADPAMDLSEFRGNLHETLAKGVDLVELVAHESIHCQQHHAKNRTLLSIALQEGAANFLAALILRPEHLSHPGNYEATHECELWQEFRTEMDQDNLSKWFYNTENIQNRPPDLGYFIGMRICEAYYLKTPNKRQAITRLLDRSLYKEVMEGSGYNGNCAGQ